MNATAQYVSDLDAPIREGYREAPKIIRECFESLLENLDDFDRALAKIDRRAGVGGELRLREDWRDQGAAG